MGTGKVVAGILTVLGLAATSAPVALAQESQENTVPPTMVILDASGSMEQADAGGKTRMDAAKEATHTFLDGVSDDSELGFITYGTGTSNAPEEREAGCEDVSTLAPLANGQVDDIRGEVDDIEASGYTPMGPALRQAADQLPDEGARNVVLVSDGLDTCAPPPVCDVAKELHEQGIDLIINTVGFLVDDEARTELECIAEAGGGRYLDANDADSLAESMRVLHTRSINAYETDLEEYEGSDSETTPTEIPADVDTFSSPLHDSGAALNNINGDAQHWRVPVEEGERLAISALTVQPPSFGGLTDNRYGMSLKFDDSSCVGDTWSQVEPNSAQGTQAVAGITEITGEDCGSDGYVDFSISRRGNFLEGTDVKSGQGISVDQLNVKVYNEARQPVMNSEGIPLNSEASTTFGHAAPLNYRNLEDSTAATKNLYQAGAQYIFVHYKRLSGSDNEEVGDGEQHTARYSLAAVAEGKPQPGPNFTEASADSSAQATDSQVPSDSSNQAAGAQDAASSEGMGATTWALIALAVLVIAGIVGGFIAKTRKAGTK